MANATVEKLKTLGIRHGEKAAVALAGVLCLLFLVSAFSKPTIELTPAELKETNKSALANIQRTTPEAQIQSALDAAKLTDPGFETIVVENAPGAADPSKYRFETAWSNPEPGAGMVRDTPVLVAPKSLLASYSRGAMLVFARDESGNPIEDTGEDQPVQQARGRRSRRGGAAGALGMGMPGARRARGGGQAEQDAEARKAEERAERRRQLALGGAGADVAAAESESEETELDSNIKYKETTKGYRLAAVIGELDNKKLRDNYLRALKDPTIQPEFRRVELQRQSLQADGTWADWEDVDYDLNQEVLLTPAYETELVPEDLAPEGLVDPLPFLKVGYYQGVHVRSLVPKEELQVKKKEETKKGRPAGGMGSYMNPGSMSEMYGPQRSMGMQGPGAMGGYGSMAGGMGGGAKPGADTLMVRSLDFTVGADTTYRYRARIVVKNPNQGWDLVRPGVDTEGEELSGPWSEPTNPVTVPGDVAVYALNESRAGTDARGEQVKFRVVKWNAGDGLTVVMDFDAAPGQIIGEPNTSAPVPDAKGDKVVRRPIDFISRQLLLDTAGGDRSLSALGSSAVGTFDAPALAVVMRGDGVMVLHDQAQDARDREMTLLKDIYDQTLEAARAGGKERPSGGGGMMGMYNMMGGGPGR